MNFKDERNYFSFNTSPNLVDNKLIKKIKKKKLEIKKNNYTNRIKKSCLEFIKENYGILLIIIFLILLLCFRYQEVKKRRNQNKN
tara:strand:+ start:100 stop:354 length:255 start_codon:yes stop_codon:yes gene_type:complete